MSQNPNADHGVHATRRQLMAGAMWAVPAVSVMVASPAFAASTSRMRFGSTAYTTTLEQNVLVSLHVDDVDTRGVSAALVYSAGLRGPATVVIAGGVASFFVRAGSTGEGWITAASAIGTTTASVLAGTPTIDDLRQRWRLTAVGESLDGDHFDENVVNAAAGELGVASYRAGLWARSMLLSSSSLWADLPLGTNSANLTSTANRLEAIGIASRTSGSPLRGDESVSTRVAAGVLRFIEIAYQPGAVEYGNWYDWAIGAPQRLLSAAIFAHGSLTPAQVTQIVDAVGGHVSDASIALATAANTSDMLVSRVLSGVLSGDPALISVGMAAVPKVIDTVWKGDGFYADGSFVQHTRVAYTGTYGAELLRGVALMAGLTAGTSWALSATDLSRMVQHVEGGVLPLLIASIVPDAVSGRACAWSGTSDNTRGRHLVAQLVRLSDVVPTSVRASWRARFADFFSRSQPTPITAMRQDEYSVVSDVLRDLSIVPSAAASSRSFTMMSRAVLRANTWGAAIAMSSTRTSYYEYGNNANRRGWHTGVGMVGWWGVDGLGATQFADDYWPTVDPYAHPGITVSRKPVPDGFGGDFANTRPSNAWAGGALCENTAAIGTIAKPMNSTLAAKKSWFFAEDVLVCLGSDISSADGYPVATVVDNRNLGAEGECIFTVDDERMPFPLGTQKRLTDRAWTHLDGTGGYVLLQQGLVDVSWEERSGRWSDIAFGGTTPVTTRRYARVSIDHGVDPTSGSYEYVMLPGASLVETRDFAETVDARIVTLAQGADAHAVRFAQSGLVTANVWAAGGPIAGVSVTQPVSFVFAPSATQPWLALAEPQVTLTSVEVTIARAGTYVGQDRRVTVLASGDRVRLRVDLSGSGGASVVLPLRWAGEEPGDNVT